jgi:hypothetical protein
MPAGEGIVDYIACALFLTFQLMGSAAAGPCVQLPPNTGIPPPLQSSGGEIALNAQGGSGSDFTDQNGRIPLGNSDIAVTLRRVFQRTSLVLLSTNTGRNVTVKAQGSGPPRTYNYPLTQNVPTSVGVPSKRINQLLITGAGTKDVYLVAACGG